MALLYAISTLVHVLAVIVAIGGATIADYLHVIGLRRKNLEKRLHIIYPHISKLINIALVFVYLTGISLVIQNPALLSSGLFITKFILVLIVTINGIYLQKSVSPHLDKCVIKGTKYCTPQVLYTSAISGSISIVTWYAILVLSLTKTLGYSVGQFVSTYIVILGLAILTAYIIEKHSRKWR